MKAFCKIKEMVSGFLRAATDRWEAAGQDTRTPRCSHVHWGWKLGLVLVAVLFMTMVSSVQALATNKGGKVPLIVTMKGEGKIKSYPMGLSCHRGVCTGWFHKHTKVTLVANPGKGQTFAEWQGACGGKRHCNVVLEHRKKVRAVFASPPKVSLAVMVKGKGRVYSYPRGLRCREGVCMGTFPQGTTVKLKSRPGKGYKFVKWQGACQGQGRCNVHLKKSKKVRAIFSPPTVRLAVLIKGKGRVFSEPKGLACRHRVCVGEFPAGTKVTLKPRPMEGQEFLGWRRSCQESQDLCQVTLKHRKLIGAKFTEELPPAMMVLNVKVVGEGTVTSDPQGLSCPGEACMMRVPKSEKVVLKATPSPGYVLQRWDGACQGTSVCEMVMRTHQKVTAVFVPAEPSVTLSVTIEGNGSVTSQPSGVNCSQGTCVEEFPQDTSLTLTPRPATGHVFVEWQGACTGSGSCMVTLDNPRSITAVFAVLVPPVALTVTVNGDGVVTSQPSGVNCGQGTCTENFPSDTPITLMAAPGLGQMFVEWQGACSGSGTCDVILASPLTVIAVFQPLPENLTDAEAIRFLEQTTWGPTPALIAHVKQVGRSVFLDEQFAMAPSSYPDPVPNSSSLAPARDQFFFNAMNGQDQLRQRMAFALGQIFVVSANTVGSDDQMIPYLRLLQNHAFGNYQDVMRAVTLSPTMGRYLDMVNNAKTDPGSGLNPNENYPREFLQLFSVGTVLLNQDGTPQLDGQGIPLPTYDQDVILNLSRVMTGWTYPTQPGATLRWRNPAYYVGPMEPFDAQHDVGTKVLMNGFVLPANQSAQEDLDQAVQHVFDHPNVGPFVATRLIRHFVMSNPSPGYVARVAQAFNANGSGVRGDLQSVLKAMFLDPEAMASPSTGGHLREPVRFSIGLLRAMDASVNRVTPLYRWTRDMGQDLFSPPSVFNYFSPLYQIPGTSLYGPEFQIHSFSNAIARANFVYRVLNFISGTGISYDLTALDAIAGDADQLVQRVEGIFLHESLTPQERQSIVDAISVTNTARTRVKNAIYLVTTSSRYQVQH